MTTPVTGEPPYAYHARRGALHGAVAVVLLAVASGIGVVIDWLNKE